MLAESRTFRSGGPGGIKPLNAPRVVHVRTDSAGNPVAVQVPPAITSPRGRRLTGSRARDPHPNPLPPRERGLSTSPPSLVGRELEGGSKLNRIQPSTTRKAREFRRNATPAENLLWKHLRKTQVEKYKFTRQHPIGPYIVDFCCRSSRLVIELDGEHHATQKEPDTGRQQYLEAQDYRVIRFWNNEVFENLEGVLFRIVEELEATDVPLAATDIHPHPNPLRLAPGVRGALGRAGSSAGHARARERGQASSPSLIGRELEGGSDVASAPSLVSDGAWVKVTEVEDLWKVNDEWWRGPEEEIARLYYTLRLDNGQQLTVYLDLIANNWYRQSV